MCSVPVSPPSPPAHYTCIYSHMYAHAGFYDVDNERVAEKDFQFKPKMLSELEGKKKSEEEAARKKVRA